MGEKQRLKLEIFGSNFHFRLERCVTNTPLSPAAVRQLFYQ